MKHSSITYRTVSVFVLTLLLSTIVVPSTISATSLFCDMEHAAMHGAVEDCCKHLSIDDIGSLATISASSDCSFQMLCEQTVPDNHKKTQAVQQVVKEIVIVALGKEIYSFPEEEQRHYNNRDLPVIKESPPIFLLNSTFLN